MHLTPVVIVLERLYWVRLGRWQREATVSHTFLKVLPQRVLVLNIAGWAHCTYCGCIKGLLEAEKKDLEAVLVFRTLQTYRPL